jgi:hypothetical protein
MAAAAPYVEVGGAELMVAPVMGGGALVKNLAPSEDQRYEVGDKGEDFVGRGLGGSGEDTHSKEGVTVTCAAW